MLYGGRLMFLYLKNKFVLCLLTILIGNLTYICNANENPCVSREDAVIEIMSIVGVDQETALNTILYTSWYEPVFNDVKACRIEDGYVLIASEYIVKGCGNRLFEPNRDISLSEILTFIERCLRNDSNIEPEQAIGFALEDKIILSDDSFYSEDGKTSVTREDLAVLIDRMSKKDIGLYVGLITEDAITYADIRVSIDPLARSEWCEINRKLITGDY